MWVDMPKEFGRDVRDLSPDEADPTKKSLYAIRFDDQQRDFSAPPKYYGVYWTSTGPGPVNEVAVSLWDRFLGDRDEDSRDCEDNIDGKGTEEGECYSGFACFGYGSIAISLDVEEVTADHPLLILRLHEKGLLKKALKLAGKSTEGLEISMSELSKHCNNPNRDNVPQIRSMICSIIGGPEPGAK